MISPTALLKRLLILRVQASQRMTIATDPRCQNVHTVYVHTAAGTYSHHHETVAVCTQTQPPSNWEMANNTRGCQRISVPKLSVVF